MSFRDLGTSPDAIVGKAACVAHDQITFRRIGLHTASKAVSVDKAIQNVYLAAADYLRNKAAHARGEAVSKPSATTVDRTVSKLLVEADKRVYEYDSYLGGGSYGRVYKFVSGEQDLAV